MIKANELRIGNSILQDGELVFVTPWRLGLIELDSVVYEPIPLTEEWLLIFGFEKVIYNDDQHGYGVEYELIVNEDVFMVMSDDFSVALYSEKKYVEDGIPAIPEWGCTKTVHGLQNLYFALSGKELEIKK